jgi:hypothetical protein
VGLLDNAGTNGQQHIGLATLTENAGKCGRLREKELLTAGDTKRHESETLVSSGRSELCSVPVTGIGSPGLDPDPGSRMDRYSPEESNLSWILPSMKGGKLYMKDWVKSYLMRDKEKANPDMQFKDPSEEEILSHESNEIENEEATYHEIAHYLNIHFEASGIGGDRGFFTQVFGSVLADLPWEVFKKLSETQNLFFTFTRNPGAEVKQFILEHDLKAGQKLHIVTFPYASILLPTIDAIKGQIAFELAYVWAECNGHRTDELEQEVEEIARSWGFEKQINALRRYKAKTEG